MAWAIVKKSGTGYTSDTYYEILIDSILDFANLPTDAAPGSIAYVANRTVEGTKSLNGEWAINYCGMYFDSLDKYLEYRAQLG